MNISQMFKASLEISAKTSGSSAIKSLTGDISTAGKTADAVNKQMGSLNGGLKALAAGFGGVQVADFITDMARATIQLDAFQAQLGIGFSAANRLELEAIRATMRRLGIAQEESIGSAVRYSTALRLSGQSAGEVNRTFEATSKLILANKLSAEGAERVFKAMQQTASKGKLMAEELSGQLGDTLAGFTQQVADAMGIGLPQLFKDMQNGKVTAEQFFAAVQKIGDGIDDSKLNSAARSLGNLKNQWFDFKTSIINVAAIRTTLDSVAAGFAFLTRNSVFLTQAIKGAAIAFGGMMLARILVPVISTLSTAIWALTFSFRTYGVAQTFAINGSLALKAVWTALAANPIGIALTGISIIMGVLAMRTKAADEASAAYGRAQSAMAGVIDITTGKINTQNAALLENARLLAKTALLKARDAETEARGGFERRVGGVSALIDAGPGLAAAAFGAPGSAVDLPGKKEADDLVRRMREGKIATADVGKEWAALTARFPGISREYGEMTKEVTALSTAQLGLRDATIQSMLVNGQRDKMTADDLAYARARGLLATDTASGAPPAAASTSTANKADPYGDRLRALQGEAAKLQFQTEGFGKFGEKVESAERALMEFATTSGEFKSLLPDQKAKLLAAASAVDEWRKKLDAAKLSLKAMNDLGEDRAKLQFQIDYFGQYGERLDSSREAAIRFRVTQGDLKALAPEVKRALLDEANAVDTLAASYDTLTKRKKEKDDLARSQVDWDAQLEDMRARAKRFGQSDFDFGQAEERRKAERDIARETIGMTNEGAEAYRKARLAALELLQAEEALQHQRENTWGGGMREALHTYGEEISNVGKSWADTWMKGLKGTEDALVNFVMTGKGGFKELARSIVEDLARIMIQQMIMAPLILWMKSMGVPIVAAKGTAFSGTGEVKKFANGGVVTSPTMFRHSGGAGLMGEAGPEAIMPLRRLGNGRLGIEATGGGQGGGNTVVTVNVAVSNDGQSSTTTEGVTGRNADQLGKGIAAAVRNEIMVQKRPGGLLAGT